jgi:opacity protein-like surface antigen
MWLRQRRIHPMRSSGRLRHWLAAALLAGGVFVVAPAAAHAQLPTAGSVEVTPFLGFSFGSDQEGPSLALGAGVGYNYTPQLAFEGEIGILPDLEGETDDVDLGVTTFSANVVYHFDTATQYVPYATAGIGFGRQSLEIAGLDDASTELAVNIGGGVKVAVNDRFTVRGDLRYFNINDENPNFWRITGGVVFRFRR